MASLIAKKIRGHTYYYARESKRLNGKPKIVWQKYLGRADDIISAFPRTAQSPPVTLPCVGKRHRLRRCRQSL